MPRIANSTCAMLIAVLAAGFTVTAGASNDASIEELKTRVSATEIGSRPRLCLQIAERQLDAANKGFVAGQSDEAKAELTDVVTYSELARDYAIQSRKHLKQTEIAVRGMTRKLNDLKHAVTHDDQSAVQEVIDRLQRARDDLLLAMFPHGKKGDQ